jgi:transposase
MPRPHIAMRKLRDALRLRFGEGLSIRQVSASLSLPHTTVQDCLRRATEAGLSWPLPEELGDDALEARLYRRAVASSAARPLPDYQLIHRELRRPMVTLMLLWVEYRESFPDGYAYSQFCDLYRRFEKKLDLVMRQEHKAGEKAFVDFPGMTIPIWDPESGEKTCDAELFVAVLGASNYVYAEALPSQELMHWVHAHCNALEAWGGCPAIVVCDNLKSGVTRPHRYEPDVNATFQDMAAHYGIAVIPARIYRPKDKAKAEGGVLLAERWIIARLRNEVFTSLGELNARIVSLVAWLNDRRFKKLEGSRSTLFFEIERPALRPLPERRYEFATFRPAKVGIDYHIEVRSERHFYSVPHRLVGEKVEVRLSARSVEVLHNGRRVASHPRAFRPGFSTDRAHMPESHRRHAEWTPSRIVSWAEKTGPETATLVEGVLSSRPHPEQGFRSCLGIVRLGERYGADRLEAACRRALKVRSYSYRSVESILKKGLDRAPEPGSTPAPSHPDHDNVRGADYYQ